jgi:hypothetical protein
MGETRKVGKGGTENGPAILPIANSFEIFCLVSSIYHTHATILSMILLITSSVLCGIQALTML